MNYIGRTLSFAAIPIVILGLLGSLSECSGSSDRPTVSQYRDHAEWSRQMREIEWKRYQAERGK